MTKKIDQTGDDRHFQPPQTRSCLVVSLPEHPEAQAYRHYYLEGGGGTIAAVEDDEKTKPDPSTIDKKLEPDA
ncbi:MAG: hypothetical protein K8F91_07510 [Candidatus Obscuribacterales bacterium]|nr:hypothetical protein [Candidatus Obscuribacterales bacterium]